MEKQEYRLAVIEHEKRKILLELLRSKGKNPDVAYDPVRREYVITVGN